MKPEQEILKEKRFEFGKNWARFLKLLNDDRIAEAEKSIQQMLQIEDLKGKTFLDIGSGSGLFSLAAMRLGSSKILSFDIDTHSVACTQELKKRYFNNAQNWSVEKGSVLDVSSSPSASATKRERREASKLSHLSLGQ
ncbi:MAG: 50S ribosomal protein L11 methyltransferase [Thermodesulfobacteriota bacterium]|nr:50S ribosomal protein L11 methyltransferase [Thermodesulfobacteriota bacterium]